jgi:hypothetical protein
MSKFNQILFNYIKQNDYFYVSEYLAENNIQYLNFIKNFQIPLKFKNNYLYGGVISKPTYIINNNKYKLLIDEYGDMSNDKRKYVDFIKINAEQDNNEDFKKEDNCGILILDEKNKQSSIQSVNNYGDCLYHKGNDEFKVGDILTKIMIDISIKRNMKIISITDVSYLQCRNDKIPLIYLRTMTKGQPYYCKFGFVPTTQNEYNVWENNIKIFKKKPTLTKNEFIKFFIYRKFDDKNENDKIMLKYIYNILVPRLQQNNEVSFVLLSIINDKKSTSCHLLYMIYLNLYLYLGYNEYHDKAFHYFIKK